MYCGKCEDFCPNNARKLYGTIYSLDRLIARVEKDRPFFTRSGGGVTFSGRIPLGLEFIYDPVSFYAELDPLITLIPGTDFDIGGGIGFRFYF